MKLDVKIRLLSVLLTLVLLFTACGTEADKAEDKVQSTEDAQVSVEKNDTDIVTSPLVEEEEKEPVVIVQPTAEQLEKLQWLSYMLPNVNEYLNVRTEPNAEASLVGRLEKGDRGIVLERGTEWTKVRSGEVEGYVNNKYCYFGEEALAYAKTNCPTTATVTTDGLRIRETMSVDSNIIKNLENGEKLVVDTAATTEEGWVAVKHNDKTYYVSAEFVNVTMEFGTATTQAEIEAKAKAEAERKAKEEQAKREAAAKVAADNAAVKEVDELTLMAALIYCEAGAEPYETQLAVGAVVMNRLKSSRYPNNLYDVIYQKGQFTPARNGKVARIIAQGRATESCYKAARAALAGEDNTNGCLRFNDYNGTQKGIMYGGMIFW